MAGAHKKTGKHKMLARRKGLQNIFFLALAGFPPTSNFPSGWITTQRPSPAKGSSIPGHGSRFVLEIQMVQPGEGPRLLEIGAGRFGTLVCYEVIFPGIPRRFAAAGAES